MSAISDKVRQNYSFVICYFFLQLILFYNCKYYLLYSFPSSLVLRRNGYSIGSNQAIRKSVDFPALSQHDCGLVVLFLPTKYKCKTNKKIELEINSLRAFQQELKKLITNQKINLFTNFSFLLNEPKFQWE